MGKKIGSSALKRKSAKFTGPSKEEIAEIRQQMEEEKEKLEGGAMKTAMPSSHDEPEHKAKPVSLADVDETIEKERKEKEASKRTKEYRVKIEEET